MVVTKPKGPTVAIKILSIFMIPFSLFMIVGCFIMLFTTKTIEETIVANAKLGAGFSGKN